VVFRASIGGALATLITVRALVEVNRSIKKLTTTRKGKKRKLS